MKKRYTSPFAEIIELGTTSLIAVSIPGETPKPDNNWADSYDAKEHRNDWENIWANM